jgi:hypothetical protein
MRGSSKEKHENHGQKGDLPAIFEMRGPILLPKELENR